MSMENEIIKKHPNMYCKGQRAHTNEFREGYDRTFGRKPWYVLRDERNLLTPRRLENDLNRMLTGDGEYCPDECSCEGRCPKTDDLEGT